MKKSDNISIQEMLRKIYNDNAYDNNIVHH